MSILFWSLLFYIFFFFFFSHPKKCPVELSWRFHLYFGLNVWNDIFRGGRCIDWFFTVILVSEFPACGSDVVLEFSAGVGT